ncbi:MAG: TetR/AcrR family transcriptional regulator [Tepidisphaeraceae bacterium]
MGTKERRERERDEMRTKILDAARELFAKEGYDAVSMRKIAEAIEYSPTAIYVHFKDKAELIRELCHEDFGQMDEGNRRVMALADPIERIRELGLHYIRFAASHPNHFRLMFMTKPSPEMVMSEEEMTQAGRGDPNQDGYALLKLSVQQAIEQGRLRPELTDVDVLTQLMWAGVHGVASLHITRPDAEQWCPWLGADRLGREMIDTIFRGMLRDDDATAGKKVGER